MIRVKFSAGTKNFHFLSLSVKPTQTRAVLSSTNQLKSEGDHSIQANAKVQNTYRFTSTPQKSLHYYRIRATLMPHVLLQFFIN